MAYGVRDSRTGQEIFVTNYSFGDKWLPLSSVRFAAMPVRNQHTIPDAEPWKYLHNSWKNPELDHGLIDWIVSQ